MSVLKNMNFVAVPRAANATPEQQRRNKLLVHLVPKLKKPVNALGPDLILKLVAYL